MMSFTCSANASKQGLLSLFFKPPTDEELVVKDALLKHRRAVEAAIRTNSANIAEQQEKLREENETLEEVEVVVSNVNTVGVTKKKKQRPHNWKEIALEFASGTKERKLKNVINRFNLDLSVERGISYWSMTLNRWAKDLAAQKEMQYKRSSSIPLAVEKALVEEVKRYNNAGVPLTNMILRMNLVSLLTKAGLGAQIAQPNSFGDPWFQRFYDRNTISCRVATTKMREDIPAHFECKRSKYLALLSVSIHDYSVPDDLILGIDETNCQFVPSVKRTRAPKGSKRIRIIRIGKEKPQITATFGGTATGEILPNTQLIFGGKTVRCHPNGGRTAPPDGIYYDHTSSHWQSYETYISYIKCAIIPYRLLTIQRLGLPGDQKCILIHDLHFSHKGDEVIELCKANNIIPLYIPAGCTDIMQMCDIVLNKPFKNAISTAFINYVADKFVQHEASEALGLFTLDLALSIMKPLLPTFVKTAMSALSTPSMKKTIRKCFSNDGLVKEARTPEALVAARALLAVDNAPINGEELQPDLGPIAEEDDEGDQEFLVEVQADEEVNGDEEVPLHAPANPIPEVAPQSALHPCIHIGGGANNTYNVNINNPPTTRKPSYSYEMVNEDVWNDGGIVDSANIVGGKRKRVAKSYD